MTGEDRDMVGLLFGHQPTASQADWAEAGEFTSNMAVGSKARWIDGVMVQKTGHETFVFLRVK